MNVAREYITIPEAAKLLGLERKAMARLLDAKAIPSIRPSVQRRVKVGDVLRYRERCRETVGELMEDVLSD